MTNSTTPELLGDEDLKEIEARPWVYPYLHNTEQRVLLKVAERDALVQTARALREKHTRLAKVSGKWANLLDRIRLWSKCADGYPLDEHINNIATQLAQLTQTLTATEACKNPKCGHCMALLRTTRRG